MISLFLHIVFSLMRFPFSICLIFIINWTQNQLYRSFRMFTRIRHYINFIFWKKSLQVFSSNLKWLLSRSATELIIIKISLQHHSGYNHLSLKLDSVLDARTLSWFTSSFWCHVSCSSFLRKGVQAAKFLITWMLEIVFSLSSC